jgi:hypothetical protein
MGSCSQRAARCATSLSFAAFDQQPRVDYCKCDVRLVLHSSASNRLSLQPLLSSGCDFCATVTSIARPRLSALRNLPWKVAIPKEYK